MKRIILSILVMTFALGFTARNLRAAEDAGEANEAAAEDAAEKKRSNELDRPIFSYAVGVLTLKSKEERGDNKGVIGKLSTKSGEYTLKLTIPEMIDLLTPLDGKQVKLRGNPRNKGKYFLVQSGELAQPTDIK